MPDAQPEPRASIHYAHWRLHGDALVFDRLASTNTTLRALAAQGAPEGTVVVADAQDHGRGRHGRAWNSPAGAGFYGSILLRPALPPARAQLLTLTAAVAVAEALAGRGLEGVEIKWPNDVLVGGRKVCGILTEGSFVEERIEWAVVGIGINLTQEAVPDGLETVATSLADVGLDITSTELLDPLLAALDRWYTALVERGADAVLARWRELAPMSRGRAVSVDDGSQVYEAVTEGITADGRLRVRRDDGTALEVSAADVTLAKA